MRGGGAVLYRHHQIVDRNSAFQKRICNTFGGTEEKESAVLCFLDQWQELFRIPLGEQQPGISAGAGLAADPGRILLPAGDL